MSEVSNWMPTSFSGATEDAASSEVTEIPEPTPTEAEPLSDDLSFDLISRQKLSKTPQIIGPSNHDRLSPKVPPMTPFEDDSRSPWSVDSTCKESVIDEDSNSIESQKPTSKRRHSEEEVSITAEDVNITAEDVNMSDEDASITDKDAVILDMDMNNKAEAVNVVAKDSNITANDINITAEDVSSTAEDVDITADNVNITSEDVNITSEDVGITADDANVTAEDANVTAEGANITAEDANITTEDASITGVDVNITAEDVNITAEDVNITAEDVNITAEDVNITAEDVNIAIGFPPENLFEYMWPSEKGEFYILQEQISDYLCVKSFKRKYPDLFRRTVDAGEKMMLKERGVVTETQCDLGLTALKSEDVMELMNKDYPDKYNEYIKVLRDKERKINSEKHKEYAGSVDKNRIVDVAKKAAKSAAEYNAHLNQERKEERRCCFDLQTFTIHYPTGPRKKSDRPKMGKYPVSLLPGQFQDSFKVFTPEELKYLPLNTVMYGPVQELKSLVPSDGSDSDDSSGSDGSGSSSQGTHDDNSGESSSGSEKNEKPQNQPICNNNSATPVIEKVPVKYVTPYRGREKIIICKICKLQSGTGCNEKNEPLIVCSVCRSNIHPTCVQLTLDMIPVLKTYPWQCMDCKTCVHCRDPYDEDKMLFCDKCDRGYHTFCVGLKTLPPGKWICPLCGLCSVCGATQAGPEGSKVPWQYDTTSSGTESNPQRKIVCEACSKRKQ